MATDNPATATGYDDKAKAILKRFESFKSERGNFEAQWEEIRDLVRPNAKSFQGQEFNGDRRTLKIYDTTAGASNMELASGLHSYCTSPVDRWFNLSVQDKDFLDDSPDSLMWLEIVSDAMYKLYAKPSVGFNPTLHEGYLDQGAFGTTVIYQDWDSATANLHFRAFPLASCFIAENSDGQVDTLYRMIEYTTRQAIQNFGADNLPKKITEENNQDKMWSFIHAVYPRSDRNVRKMRQQDKAWASCWVSKEASAIVKESGYDSFPYHVPRWTKVAGEVYGRSPAMECLPTIKMINEMQKTILRAGQKVVDPPLVVDHEAFMLPIKTFPSALIYRDSSEGKIEPLITGGRVEIGIELITRAADQVSHAFFIDWLRAQKNNVQMTATEVVDRRDEQLRLLAPMLGRLQAELLSPLLKRTYELMNKAGMIPPAPPELARRKLIVDYVSPAAIAQNGSKIGAMSQTFRDLAEVATVAPTVLDRFDFDEVANQYVTLRNVSRKVLRTNEAMAALRKERKDMQTLQQGADVGGKIAGTVKDLAMAQAAGGTGQ